MRRLSVVRTLGIVLLATFIGSIFPIATVGAADAPAYTLGSGDKVRITVYDEKDLSGEFDVNDQGFVSLPLIGQVQVGSKTLSEVGEIVTKAYAKDYLVNPRVSVEVLNYRPFFILGEVNHPNSYPFVNGMTVIEAVSLAGGYTPRADKTGIHIKHVNRANVGEQPAREDTPILPGDVIRVGERFF